jgi:spore maturation protein CgeB
MKVLCLGDIASGQTSLMRMRALERLGHQVMGVNTVEPWRKASWLRRQLQRRMHCGSVVRDINASVLSSAQGFRPRCVWAEKQEFLYPETVQELRMLGACTLHFTPDPYFTLDWKRTPLMDAAMKEFDVLVYCKSYERRDYEALGRQLVYMPLGYCDEVHRALPSCDGRWACDVGFLGGWEPRREEMLAPLASAGLRLRIWGSYWDFLRDGRWTIRRKLILDQLAGVAKYRIHRNETLAACLQGAEVYQDDYARALTGSKIGIGFLRRVCPDQHTTRTFEIPACGSMLLADRTAEHQDFFHEGREAEFFSSKEELLEKARFYCNQPSIRNRIARAGHERCIRSRYAYIHRLSDVLSALQEHF